MPEWNINVKYKSEHTLKFNQVDKHLSLVGGFSPSEKYARQIEFKLNIFPNFRGETKHVWVATT